MGTNQMHRDRCLVRRHSDILAPGQSTKRQRLVGRQGRWEGGMKGEDWVWLPMVGSAGETARLHNKVMTHCFKEYDRLQKQQHLPL